MIFKFVARNVLVWLGYMLFDMPVTKHRTRKFAPNIYRVRISFRRQVLSRIRALDDQFLIFIDVFLITRQNRLKYGKIYAINAKCIIFFCRNSLKIIASVRVINWKFIRVHLWFNFQNNFVFVELFKGIWICLLFFLVLYVDTIKVIYYYRRFEYKSMLKFV